MAWPPAVRGLSAFGHKPHPAGGGSPWAEVCTSRARRGPSAPFSHRGRARSTHCAPWQVPVRGVTLSAMTTQTSNAQRSVAAAAHDLRDVARVASPPDALDLLDEVADALSELASACEDLGPALVPRPRGAAFDWRVDPAGDGSPDPLSHQEKRLALSTLHDLGASIRAAARRTRDARATLRPVAERASSET